MRIKKQIYQIKITLNDSAPPIWRRLRIDSRYHLDDLHAIIQDAIGWEYRHLHQFSHKGVTYVQYDAEFSQLLAGQDYEMGKPIALFLQQAKDTLMYEYDMGDGWQHTIELEKILPADKAPILTCIDGQRACPPEDCGGMGGYEYLIEILADETHDKHADMLEWLGLQTADGFNPDIFSKEEVNQRFAR